MSPKGCGESAGVDGGREQGRLLVRRRDVSDVEGSPGEMRPSKAEREAGVVSRRLDQPMIHLGGTLRLHLPAARLPEHDAMHIGTVTGAVWR